MVAHPRRRCRCRRTPSFCVCYRVWPRSLWHAVSCCEGDTACHREACSVCARAVRVCEGYCTAVFTVGLCAGMIFNAGELSLVEYGRWVPGPSGCAAFSSESNSNMLIHPARAQERDPRVLPDRQHEPALHQVSRRRRLQLRSSLWRIPTAAVSRHVFVQRPDPGLGPSAGRGRGGPF